MKYLAVTTCNAEQWSQYGRAMARTFCRYWPAEVPLWVYAEGFEPSKNLPICAVDLDIAAPWLEPWKAERTAAQRGMANGKYTFKTDAVRFAHKVAAIGAAAREGADVLIWIDADTVTHAPVTVGWLYSLFPPRADVAWLDRGPKYPECGFLMFRLPNTLAVIDEIVSMYRSGAIFSLPQTHDSYVIQHVVEAAAKRGEIKVASLSGDVPGCHHPFVAGPLGSRMDHLKGTQRKEAGRSFRTDSPFPRREPYWR